MTNDYFVKQRLHHLYHELLRRNIYPIFQLNGTLCEIIVIEEKEIGCIP